MLFTCHLHCPPKILLIVPSHLTALWHYLEFLAGVNQATMPSQSVFIPTVKPHFGIDLDSAVVDIYLNFVANPSKCLACGIFTSFMCAGDATIPAQMAQGITIAPAFMGWS